MRISGISSTPSFGKLFTSEAIKTDITCMYDNEDKYTLAQLRNVIDKATGSRVIIADHFEDGKGIIVQEYDSSMKNITRTIAHNSEDILLGLRSAAQRLQRESEVSSSQRRSATRIYSTPRRLRRAEHQTAGRRLNEFV